MKKYFNAGTLELMEAQAKSKKMTLDAYLLEDSNNSFATMPDTRNEKITGDKATLEIKDKDKKDNEWQTVPFVKENGVWKTAFDEYMKDLPQKMKEEIEKQTNSSANANVTEQKK